MKVLHQSGDDIIERECRSHLVEGDVGMLLDHFNRCCMGWEPFVNDRCEESVRGVESLSLEVFLACVSLLSFAWWTMMKFEMVYCWIVELFLFSLCCHWRNYLNRDWLLQPIMKLILKNLSCGMWNDNKHTTCYKNDCNTEAVGTVIWSSWIATNFFCFYFLQGWCLNNSKPWRSHHL